ncbi:hypothetical protein D3C73_1205930 [compost metagenome]
MGEACSPAHSGQARFGFVVCHEDVAVGADFSRVVHDAGRQLPGPAHRKCRQRHRNDRAEAGPGAVVGLVRRQEIRRGVVKDHLHSQLPRSQGPHEGFPVRREVQPDGRSRLGVQFVLQQVAGLGYPVIQDAT